MRPDETMAKDMRGDRPDTPLAADDADRLREVAHELRSPLGGIESMIELLSRSALDESQKRLVAGLQSASRHLRAVAGEIIGAAAPAPSPAAEVPEATPEFLDIRAFLADFSVSAEARARVRGLGFAIRCAPAVPREAGILSKHLRQMLENLVDNAFKHARGGVVSLDVSFIDDRDGFCALRFAVRDEGEGIRADQIDRLFRPHGRVAGDTTDGTGMGLSIVRRLARQNGGDAGVDSVPGLGSAFWFTLRLRTPRAIPARPPSAAPRVLVVDDSASGRTILCAILGHFGYRTEQAASGEEALEALSRARFDAVTIDRTLPGIGGEETVRRLRALPGPAALTPVVAITGHVLPEHRRAFEAAGANGFVAKPVTAKGVIDAVARAIAEAPRDAA